MTKPDNGNVEQVLGSALGVPMNIISGLAELLIAKDVISREEMVSLLQRMSDLAPKHGKNEDMVRMMLEAMLLRFQKAPPPGSGH